MSRLKENYYKILNRGTEFFGLDLKYFASGGFWATFGQSANAIIALLLTVVFANLLPKETYGLYRYILSVAGILNIFTLTGMNQAVFQAVSAGNEGALKTSVKYQLKWNLMMLSVFWILGVYYFLNANPTFAVSFFILGVFSPLIAAFNTYGAYLAGKKEFRLNNIFNVISTSVYAASIIAAIILSGGVVGLVVAYSLATFAANLIFYIATLRIFKPPAPPAGGAGGVLKYGRELTFIGFIAPIVSQIDSIILNHFWGPVYLAVYSLAMAIPDKAIPFIKSWVDVGFPKLATKTPEEINRVFYKRIFQGLAIGAALAIAYIVVAPYVFKYLMPKYLDAVFYSQLLAISFVFAMPNRYISSIFTAQKLTRLIFINSMVQNILRILFYAILGIWGGIMGLVLAQVLYQGVSVFINIVSWKISPKL